MGWRTILNIPVPIDHIQTKESHKYFYISHYLHTTMIPLNIPDETERNHFLSLEELRGIPQLLNTETCLCPVSCTHRTETHVSVFNCDLWI